MALTWAGTVDEAEPFKTEGLSERLGDCPPYALRASLTVTITSSILPSCLQQCNGLFSKGNPSTARNAQKDEGGFMRRVPILLLIAAFLVSGVIVGCRDESDPEFLLDQMHDRPWRESALKNIKEMFNTKMQENNNDLNAPAVKELTNILVPGLIKGFKTFTRDKFNRKDIIELLAQMKDERSVEVFLEGLTLEDTSDATMFSVSANAVTRQKVEKSLPKLLKAYEMITKARDRRPGAPFTNAENVIAQSIISSVNGIVPEYPNTPHKSACVEMLIEIVDTPDTLQELRLNMKAMKALGKIGDPAAVPVLIRGIAMKGTRQPIGLGQIAFAALQQIHDRDAVVDGIIKFAKMEDAAFKNAFAKEIKNDKIMSNPTWYLQQGVDFLGTLNYSSPKAIEFLVAELNHTEPDALDETASKIEGLPVNYDPDGWATMRRNWAAVALGQMAYKPLLDTIKDRIVFKKEGTTKTLQIQAEEAVGYIRAMGLLLYPDQSCPIILEVAKAGDDSLRDKTFYNASLMCGEEFLPEMQKAHDKIDCEEIVEQRVGDDDDPDLRKQAENECDIMKKRIVGYMDRIKFGSECKKDVDCYLKAVADPNNKNIERAIYAAYQIARDDENQRQKVVHALTENLGNPSKVALQASIHALDHLTPEGEDELVKKIQVVYREFARQSTYLDRARLLEAFVGHVRNRGRK